MSMDLRQKACRNCTERWVKIEDGKAQTCHSTCEKYIEEVRLAKEAKEIADKKRMPYLSYIGYDCDKRRRLCKKH